MPHEVGVNDNGHAIDDEHRAIELGHVLSAAGYECVYGGKWHVPEISMPEGHGFRTICPFDDVGLPAAVDAFLAGREADRPFLLVASFDNPHNICEWRREQNVPWGEIGRPPAPEACPSLPANFEIPPYEPEIIRATTLADRKLYPDERYTPDQWRRYRWAYYRLVELVDGHAAHRLVQKSFLYEEATRVPFVLAAPDVAEPGSVDGESLVASCLDAYATILDYAGVAPPAGAGPADVASTASTARGAGAAKAAQPGGPTAEPLWDGAQSVRSALTGRAPLRRDSFVVTETQLHRRGARGRMVRSRRYKYCAWEWGAYREQLFDLERDPGEMVNLAVDDRCAAPLAEHREMLRAWCRATGDAFSGHHYSHPATPFMIPGDAYPQTGDAP